MMVFAFDTGPKSHGWALLNVTDDDACYLKSGTVDATTAEKWLPLHEDFYFGALLAIECPLHAFSAKLASSIIATARAAGELGGAAKARGYRVEYITAADWRAGLLGAANAHDGAVKAWVEQHIQGWPKKSNPHTRDAAALAVWAGRRWLRGQQ